MYEFDAARSTCSVQWAQSSTIMPLGRTAVPSLEFAINSSTSHRALHLWEIESCTVIPMVLAWVFSPNTYILNDPSVKCVSTTYSINMHACVHVYLIERVNVTKLRVFGMLCPPSTTELYSPFPETHFKILQPLQVKWALEGFWNINPTQEQSLHTILREVEWRFIC